jgi:DNA replication protein DnaC
MLNNQTTEKLFNMKLPAMSKEYRRQMEHAPTISLSFDERFGMLVDAEWTNRRNNQLHKLLKRANLKIGNACLEDIDYKPEHNIDKDMVSRLADCSWVKEGRVLIITGKTGTGKTFLACAFGNAACRQGFKVKYYRVNRLLSDLAIGRGDGSYNKLMRDLKKVDLLILDDFGMANLDPATSRDLLEVIDDRFGTRGTVIASQLPVMRWHELFEDSTIADAVLDRLVHNAYRFAPDGDTKRKDQNPLKEGDDMLT